MRRDLCLVAACLAGFVFSGCASFSGIHWESQPTSPSALAYTADIGGDGVLVPGDWPRADWWTMFRDPKLDALMQQALARNPTCVRPKRECALPTR